MNLTTYRDFMVELANRSGDLIRPYFGANEETLDIEFKPQETSIATWPSIVTRADREAEELRAGDAELVTVDGGMRDVAAKIGIPIHFLA